MKGWDKEEIVPDGGDHHVCVPMAVRLEIEPGNGSTPTQSAIDNHCRSLDAILQHLESRHEGKKKIFSTFSVFSHLELWASLIEYGLGEPNTGSLIRNWLRRTSQENQLRKKKCNIGTYGYPTPAVKKIESYYDVPEGVDIRGRYNAEFAKILTKDALKFVAELQREFRNHIKYALECRREKRDKEEV
ncbi:hypothetical protein JHK85_012124 [Glycine max]|nr:hypothetical protein JHK85_012124 [Glycine max]